MGYRLFDNSEQPLKYQLSMVFKNQVDDILKLAQGIDNRQVVPHTEAKSISAEETFPADIKEKDILLAILQHQVEEVSQRLRAEKFQCRTITLKFRYGDFRTITRSLTMGKPHKYNSNTFTGSTAPV